MFNCDIALAALRVNRNLAWCLILNVSRFGSSVALTPSMSLQQSLDFEVPWRPIPVVIDNKKLLLYELHVTNFASTDLALKRIEIVDSAGAVLSDLRDSELKGIIGRIDRPVGATDRLLIPPGVRALAYLSVPLTLSAVNAGLIVTQVSCKLPI